MGDEVDIPPHLLGIVRNYQVSRMGGETFQWQTGHWGDMPVMIIEMFIELSSGVNEGIEKRRERNNNTASVRNPTNARRNPYTSS